MNTLTISLLLLTISLIIALPWLLLSLRKKQQLERELTPLRELQHDQQHELSTLHERNNLLTQEKQQQANQIADISSHLNQAKQQIAVLEQRVQHKNEQLSAHKAEQNKTNTLIAQLREQNTKLHTNLAALQSEHEHMQQGHSEKLALLDDAKTKLSQAFKLLANQIFEEKQSKMTASSKETLDHIIKPMQKDMADFKQRMEQVHKEDIEARSALSQHLSQLKELNMQMSQDTLNLTQALKGDSKAQGNWGEMILEKLLESSGLREGYEFKREQSFVNDEGKRQRPDVIINMPGNKQVIIDAKVSLTDYERAMSAQSNTERKQYIRAHCKSIQTHIQTLANKRYDHLEGVHSPDYVLMFMPIEAAYLMAIEADRSMFESAFDKRIAVVTPSTLYATLKLIEQLWRYERQSENVAKLTKQAGNLHDKFVGFIESFEDIQTHMGRAQKSYDKAFGQLKNGRGNLINQVQTLADLSGKAKKEIPAHLLSEQIGEQEHVEEDKP
ncbi:MAG: DNA recombination protein RmuC [Ghiorsea sp.]|nr:DNA recombination protein RmuC [Ghiorsea sp.]